MKRLTRRTESGGIKYTEQNIYTEDIVERLAYYEDLEEQGFLLRLPCNIGETLYYIGRKCDICEEDDCYGCPYNRNGAKRDERFVHEFKVEQFRVRDNSIRMVNTDAIYDSQEISIDIKDFGNIVFSTEKEAEEKLKELQSK